MTLELATIGYEGTTIEDFVATLECAGVAILIDVRANAVSRKPGFSKSLLRTHVNKVHIDYHHLRGLGDPKEGRDAAKRGDFDEFRAMFSQHMKSPHALGQLEIVNDLVRAGRTCCLMCFERQPMECHRSIVAAAVALRTRVQVIHLGVTLGIGAAPRLSVV